MDWMKNNGIVLISAMSQSLTCSVVTTEGSFHAVLRSNILVSALKAVLNLEEEGCWCLVWFRVLVQDIFSGYTVKLTQLNTKWYWRNMYLIAINQPAVFMQDITPCHTAKSV